MTAMQTIKYKDYQNCSRQSLTRLLYYEMWRQVACFTRANASEKPDASSSEYKIAEDGENFVSSIFFCSAPSKVTREMRNCHVAYVRFS